VEKFMTSFMARLKQQAVKAHAIETSDPWKFALHCARGTIGDDGIERVTTQLLFDILQVAQRNRGAGASRVVDIRNTCGATAETLALCIRPTSFAQISHSLAPHQSSADTGANCDCGTRLLNCDGGTPHARNLRGRISFFSNCGDADTALYVIFYNG
jgi:hypothetical protein